MRPAGVPGLAWRLTGCRSCGYPHLLTAVEGAERGRVECGRVKFMRALLRALLRCCGSGPDEEMTEGDGDGTDGARSDTQCASALVTRARIRKLVLAGSIDAAIAAVRDEFPSLWQQDDAGGVAFHLHGQKFLELLAAQQSVQAVQYARTHLATYRYSDDPARRQTLEVCVSSA